MRQAHPWEKAWKSGRWQSAAEPLPAVVAFAERLRRARAKRVLDLGAGGGRHTVLLAGMGFQVVALDVSGTALGRLAGLVEERGLDNALLVLHEMRDLPFVSGYFDAVVSTNVLHHGLARDVKSALGEVRRVTKRGGMGLFEVISDKDYRFGSGKRLEERTFVFTEGEEKGIVHHFFSESELRSFLSGFRVTSMREEVLGGRGRRRAHIYAEVRKP